MVRRLLLLGGCEARHRVRMEEGVIGSIEYCGATHYSETDMRDEDDSAKRIAQSRLKEGTGLVVENECRQ